MNEELGLLVTGWDGANLHFLAVFKAHLIAASFWDPDLWAMKTDF